MPPPNLIATSTVTLKLKYGVQHRTMISLQAFCYYSLDLFQSVRKVYHAANFCVPPPADLIFSATNCSSLQEESTNVSSHHPTLRLNKKQSL